MANDSLLDYASNQTQRIPWGPILFKPSLRSLVLLALTAAAFFWVSKRHVAWKYVAAIPPSELRLGGSAHSFTPSNHLLICGAVARVYDADTGQLLHTLGQPDQPNRPNFTYPL